MKLFKIISDLLPIPGYAIVIICFFLPFFTIKCGNTELVSVSGFDLAKGVNMERKMKESDFAKEMKKKMSDDYGIDEDALDKNTAVTEDKALTDEKKDNETKPAILLIIPFVLAVGGFIMGFIRQHKRGLIHVIITVLSLVCLAVFGITMKNSPELNSLNAMGSGAGSGMGGAFGDAMKITVGLGNAYFVACFFLVVILAFYGFEMYWKKNFMVEKSNESETTTKDESIDTFFNQ